MKTKSFYITGILSALVILFFPITNFFIVIPILDSFSFVYADLYRNCGDWCYQPSIVGWMILVTCFVVLGLICGYLGEKIYQKTKRFQIRINIFVVVFVFVAVFVSVCGAQYIKSIKHTSFKFPPSIRCYSVIHNPDEKIGKSFADQNRINCAFELAEDHKDISWCENIEEEIVRSNCVGIVAKVTNNSALCEQTETINKDFCLEQTRGVNKTQGHPQKTMTALSIGDDVFADQRTRTRYFKNADISHLPKILWEISSATNPFSQVLALDTYILAEYQSEKCEDIALYDTKNGQALWVLRGKNHEGLCSWFNGSPAFSENIIVYADVSTLYAQDMVTGKELWRKAVNFDESPIVESGVVYIMTELSRGTGDPQLVLALDIMTGKVIWQQTINIWHSPIDPEAENARPRPYPRYNPRGAVSSTKIFLATTSIYERDSKTKICICILDKKTGELLHVVRKQVGGDVRNTIGAPVYADGLVFVRTEAGIFAADENTGEVRHEYDEPIKGYNSADEPNTPQHLAIFDHTIYYNVDNHQLVARDVATGQYLWRAELDGPANTSPIVSDSYVYTATATDLYAINRKTGNLAWKFKLPQSIESSLQVSNGTIFFVSTSHRLYALK